MKAKINKTDKVILALCMLAILICLYVLFNLEKFFESGRSASVIVGNLTSVKVDVRLKSESDYFWVASKPETKIFQGDSLFTGEKSSSVVTLNDGEKLQISQNSLVHFSGDKNRLQIDLAFGNIKTFGLEKPLIIMDCGQKYVIEPTQAQFELSKSKLCGSFHLVVKTGAVQVTKHKVKKTFKNSDLQKDSLTDSFATSPTIGQFVIPVLAPPQVIPSVVTPESVPVVVTPTPEPVPVVVSSPPEPKPVITEQPRLATPKFKQTLQNIIFKSDTKVRLSWNPVSGASTYRLEIADNKKFHSAKTVQIKKNSYDFLPPTSGDYHFRTQALAGGYNSSKFSTPAVVRSQYPPIEVVESKFVDSHQARSPADTGQRKKFPLNWNAIPTAEKYVIEVDKSSEFTNPTKTEVLAPAGYAEVLQTGNYYFRVSALDSTGRKISSMPNLGEIIYKKLDQISGPLIENAYKSLSFYFQKEYGQFIWLRWKSSLEGSKYRVEVAQDRDFSKVDFTLTAAESKILIKSKLHKGDYYWRVRSESSENVSGWSETSELRVRTK